MIEAGLTEHDAVLEAIEASGLTVAEVADRAGLDPADLGRFPVDRVPLAVLARLADVVGLPLGLLLHRWRDHAPEDPADCSAVGAYLAELGQGLSRDELAEALEWPLLRVERALAALDAALRTSGMRLGLRAGRIVVVGRLDRTRLNSRLTLERLSAGELWPELAHFIWAALDGIAPERITDRDTFGVADRLGLVWGSRGRIRVSQPVEFSVYPATNRHYISPSY